MQTRLTITIRDQCMFQSVNIVGDNVAVARDDIGNVKDLVYLLDSDNTDDQIRQTVRERINDNPDDYTITIERETVSICPACGEVNYYAFEDGAVDGPRQYHASCWASLDDDDQEIALHDLEIMAESNAIEGR